MGYTHGKRWDDDKIRVSLLQIVEKRGGKTMPTHFEILSLTGDGSLVDALVNHGGTKRFAEMLGLQIKQCESEVGDAYEELCAEQIRLLFGYDVKKMKPRYPYDLLVEGCLKVDAKVSHLYTTKQNTKFYTFNLEKQNPTCDLFVCYCVDRTEKPVKTLIIPSGVVSGKKQLSVGLKSNYDKYADRWETIRSYVRFFQDENLD